MLSFECNLWIRAGKVIYLAMNVPGIFCFFMFFAYVCILNVKKQMSAQRIVVCGDLEKSVAAVLSGIPHDRLFVLVDAHTSACCLPSLSSIKEVAEASVLQVGAGDAHKGLESLSQVWSGLSGQGASRHSLLLNVGGGMITDLGGFAASTFKRGIHFVNIPTTLLAMVDAAVGGKTGINFNGLKNEVGTFALADCVLVSTEFLRTLDEENLLSGYAEMLKHGLISTEKHWAELLRFDLEDVDYGLLEGLVAQSIRIKEAIVEKDPHEQGIRKALNLGHTVGHAFESLALERGCPVLHGYAVAWGIVCELYLSAVRLGFPADKLRQTVSFIKGHYGMFSFDCHQYDRLYELMTHDKKNEAGRINFTLLRNVGDIAINQQATKEDIFEMLDFYRESN